MTTFTRISDNEVPVIEVNPDRKLSKIDPMIYGGFTECVQDGPTVASPNQTLPCRFPMRPPT